METVTVFRPVGVGELALIRESGFKRFPPRLFHQPIFYPVQNEDYAVRIARDWNTRDKVSGYAGYVTRFEVDREFLSRYTLQKVGGALDLEWWIPAEELEAFNDAIRGPIEVVREFHGRAPDATE